MNSTSVPEPVSEVKVSVLKKMLSKSYAIALAAVIGGSVLTCIVPLVFAVLDQERVNYLTYPFAFAAVLLSYGLVAIAPAVSFGANRGWKAGILVIVYEVFWLAFIALLIAFLAPSDMNLS